MRVDLGTAAAEGEHAEQESPQQNRAVQVMRRNRIQTAWPEPDFESGAAASILRPPLIPLDARVAELVDAADSDNTT
jgi:hypothetical protein